MSTQDSSVKNSVFLIKGENERNVSENISKTNTDISLSNSILSENKQVPDNKTNTEDLSVNISILSEGNEKQIKPNPDVCNRKSTHNSSMNNSILLETDEKLRKQFSLVQTMFGSIQGQNILFCIETSGSMLYALNAVKQHLSAVLFQLASKNSKRTMNILEFCYKANMWKDTMQPWDMQSVSSCMKFIREIGPIGAGSYKSLFHALSKYPEIDSVYIVTSGFLSDRKSDVIRNIKRIMNGRLLNIIFITKTAIPDRDKTLYLQQLTLLTEGIFSIVLVEHIGSVEHIALIYNSKICGKYLPSLTVNDKIRGLAEFKKEYKKKKIVLHLKKKQNIVEDIEENVFNPFTSEKFQPLDGNVDPLKEPLYVAASVATDPDTHLQSPFYGMQHHWYWPGYAKMPQRWWIGPPDIPFYKPYSAWNKLPKLNYYLSQKSHMFDPFCIPLSPSCHDIMVGKRVLVQMKHKLLVFKFGIVRTPVIHNTKMNMKFDELCVQLCIHDDDTALLTNKNTIITTIDNIIDYDDNILKPITVGDLVLAPPHFHKSGRYEFGIVVSGEENRDFSQKGKRRNLTVEWVLNQKRIELFPNTAVKAHMNWMMKILSTSSLTAPYHKAFRQGTFSLKDINRILADIDDINMSITRTNSAASVTSDSNKDQTNENDNHYLPPTPDLPVIDEMIHEILRRKENKSPTENGPPVWQQQRKSKWLHFKLDATDEEGHMTDSNTFDDVDGNENFHTEELSVADQQDTSLLTAKCEEIEENILPTNTLNEIGTHSQRRSRLKWNEVKYLNEDERHQISRSLENSISHTENLNSVTSNNNQCETNRVCFHRALSRRCSKALFEQMRELVNQQNE